MPVRKAGTVAFHALRLVFVAMVAARVGFGRGYAVGRDLLPLVPAAVVTVTSRWRGAPDSPRVAPEPLAVAAPVTGRWSALNSPADRTPSHGIHAHGQTCAIDVLAEPGPGARPGFGRVGPIARPPRDFPSFGAPVLSAADATVVRAADERRDHLSRHSPPGLVHLMPVEGVVRELTGTGRILGNHGVLDLGNGTYAAYAHLRRGSLTVREGDRVRAGRPIARCGDSGNSTEPRLHFQLMDAPDPDAARGVPFTWNGIGVPRDKETFEAPPAVLHST
ncbi:peptidoglycan DD-metalloendopeptidase family protein [Streptomyces sp. NPDC058741]|uniref:peptidoglycan DD-metalloendopeptidase family protein n=1 Tax=unclassified Streptomyces TaxID=2593676 RepID=UPI0036C2B00D